MKNGKRYNTSGLTEAQFEPGSKGCVLKNLLGIKKKREMDRIEAEALKQTVNLLVRSYDKDHRFKALDVCNIHKSWLGGIYEWAGKHRQVNLSRGGFIFAAAGQISALIKVFEQGPLRQHTPCNFELRWEVYTLVGELPQ